MTRRTTTLSREPFWGHRVRCSGCGYDKHHPDVRDAVNDYVDHTCSTDSKPVCGCATCVAKRDGEIRFMVVCSECGNKRCPKATHHDNTCTGSNEPGQAGSRYA